MDSLDLSICIVSFNTRDVLERTIRAVLADASGLRAEVIVVDNGSADGSSRMVEDMFPAVRLVSNPQNRFFAAANNQAMALSSGRYVLTLNSDAEVVRPTLEEAVGYLDAHPDIGAITTRMTYPDGRLQTNCARFSSFRYLLLESTFLGLVLRGQRKRLRRWIRYGDWDRQSERQVEVMPGSLILTRREVLLAVGRYDERFRLYFTDDDWCLRLREAGLQAMYLPIGGVVHPEGTSVRQNRRQARRIYFEDLAAYTGKHFGSLSARWLSLLTWPSRRGWALADRLRGG